MGRRDFAKALYACRDYNTDVEGNTHGSDLPLHKP